MGNPTTVVRRKERYLRGVGRYKRSAPKQTFMNNIDTYGQEIDSTYRIITDPFFEKRLQAFDPNLKLMFDQNKKRWVILEKAGDKSGWNCIIKCEFKDGTERPLGNWVFEKLRRYRDIHELKMRMGVDGWLNKLRAEAFYQKDKLNEEASVDHQLALRDDITQWRKASKELHKLPVADATAGYPKVNV